MTRPRRYWAWLTRPRNHRRWRFAAVALLGMGCHACPPVSAIATDSRDRAPPSGPTHPTPSADDLAELLRTGGWLTATHRELHALEYPDRPSLYLLLADYPHAERSRGAAASRRIALFAAAPDLPAVAAAGGWRPELRARDVLTLELGNVNTHTVERRDIDGDGARDLVIHYARTGPGRERGIGWVGVASRSGRIVHAPLYHPIAGTRTRTGGRAVVASAACWVAVEGRPVMLVNWQGYGDGAVRVGPSSAFIVDADGLAAVRLFAGVAAAGPELPPLIRTLGSSRAGSPGFATRAESLPDCPLAPEGAFVVSDGNEYAVVAGFAFARAGVGEAWPAELRRPAEATVLELQPAQHLTVLGLQGPTEGDVE